MTSHAPESAKVARSAIVAAHALRSHLDGVGNGASRRDTLFESSVEVEANGFDFLAALARISGAVEAGHTCSLELVDEGSLTITWRAGADPDIEGDPDFVLDPVEQLHLRRQIES